MPFSEFVYAVRQLSPLECQDSAYHPSACATAWGKLIYGKRFREFLFATPKPVKKLLRFPWTEEDVVEGVARAVEMVPAITQGIVKNLRGAYEHHRRTH